MLQFRIRLVTGLLALACLALVPAAARAQSAITGTVKDSSGAVMPGVTIEAASEVLIEGVRSAVADENGAYRIVDLRPGTYKVTFTLPGFNTFVRDGLELPAGFTATIDAEMRVGALEETVTVTGQSPVVDVQSTSRTQVLNRDVLDSVPTGRSIQGLGQLVVGINLNIPDVGGSRAMQQTYMSTRGLDRANVSVLVDGMMVNGLQGDGAIQSYFNDMMSQEVSYQTSSIGADTSAGGIRLNMIPREGGNRFSGSFFSSWRDGAWQGDNFTDRLKARGLQSPSAIDRIYDFNVAEGGPIKRDKLWFFGTARMWSVDAPIAGTFFDDGSPGIDDQKIKSALLRMTWQVSQKHKFAAYFDEIDKYRGHAMSVGDDPETASVVWNSPAYHTASAKWTSTISSKLLFEGGWSNNTENYTNEYRPGVERPRGTAEWYAAASRSDLDLVTRNTAAVNQNTQLPRRYAAQASLSYVTGAHNFKAGVQRTWGTFGHTLDSNADLVQQYRSGVPNSVLVRNTPYESIEELSQDVGVFAQDQWTLKRLTVNAGIRWEHIDARVPEQTAPAGRFVGARSFAAIEDVPKWSNFAPRFGLVYDVFGNGKTALKYSLNRYNLARTTGLAQIYNPLASATATLAWTDVNRDDIAQGELGCVYLTPGCEINMAQLPANFGLRATDFYDPDTARTWNLENAIELQQEILPGVSLGASWFHGDFRDLLVIDNQNVTKNDWTAYQVFHPISGQPFTIYDFNKFATKPAVSNLQTTSDVRNQKYDAFNLTTQARLPKNINLFGGLNIERSTERCDNPDNPNLDAFCDDSNLAGGFTIPFQKQLKLSITVPLPMGFMISGSLQSNPGTNDLTNTVTRETGATSWLLSSTSRYPTTCPAPCPAGQVVLPTLRGTPTSANLTVPLIPFNSNGDTARTERVNQLDLRLNKSFQVGSLRLQPQLEVFNVFNADSIILYRNSNFGASTYLNAAGILNGRIVGVGLQARW